MSGDVDMNIIGEQSGTAVDHTGTARTVNHTMKDVSLLGDTELIPAQGAGVRIRVLALAYRSGLAVSVRFKGSGNLTAALPLGVNGELQWQHNPHGWFETDPNAPLNVNQTGAVTSGAQIVWMAVP